MARRLPPLSSLRPFEAAARLESFSRAAEELHLTHGAVSHQVRALEDHLGTALFTRAGKRVALTPAGRALAERIRGALEEIGRAAEAARTRHENRLSVSVLPSFASRWLMPRLIRFMEKHPDLEVSINASTGLADFAAEEVDLAIRFGVGPWPPLECERFLDDEYFPVASPTMNRGRLPKAPADLLKPGVRIIREDRDYWSAWFRAAGVSVEDRVRGPLFNDSTYSLQAAARGEGIALARRSIVGDDLERGILKRLFPLGVPSRERYWFACPKELADAPNVKAFCAWVKAELAASRPAPATERASARAPRRARSTP